MLRIRGIIIVYALIALAAVIRTLDILFVTPAIANEVSAFTPDRHPYIPPSADDVRSPCPALNTLANHGYIPRDGRKISTSDFLDGLTTGFGLSYPLSTVLTYGTYLLLRQAPPLSLQDIDRHGCVEHDFSIAHDDILCRRYEWAPTVVNEQLFDGLMHVSTDGRVFTLAEAALLRVLRESGPESLNITLDGLHAEIARGELSMVLGIFGGEDEVVPLKMLREWWIEERFPTGWKPQRTQTLWRTIKTSKAIQKRVNALKKSD